MLCCQFEGDVPGYERIFVRAGITPHFQAQPQFPANSFAFACGFDSRSRKNKTESRISLCSDEQSTVGIYGQTGKEG